MIRPLITALLSAAMSFQLLLVGGGEMCVTPSASAETSSDFSMAGMEMPTDDKSGTEPCDQPASPATCLTFAPCTASGIVAEAPAMASVRHIALAVTRSSVRLQSRTSAPEPPPPRS